MVRAFAALGIFIALMASHQKSFIGTAPTPSETTGRENLDSKMDKNVAELENLKNSLGRIFPLRSSQTRQGGARLSHSTGINGEEDALIDNENVKLNGKLLAKLYQQQADEQLHYPLYESTGKTDGVDKSESSGNEQRQHYSPLDMAEYVFWTGDEKSVSQTIEEFLQQNMMSKQEAISFLQEIKSNLDYLKNHYSNFAFSKNYPKKETENNEVKHHENVGEEIKTELNQLRKLQEEYKKRNVEKRKKIYATSTRQPQVQRKISIVDGNGEYDELMERLRLADFLYTEYSLEEIIYQLAKIMFSQSLTEERSEAQKSLTKFMNFLEKEAEQGHISRTLEKKVLDVLIASLTDTVNEHPELFNLKLSDGNERKLFKELLELSPEDKEILREIINPQPVNNRLDKEKENNNNLHLPFGMIG